MLNDLWHRPNLFQGPGLTFDETNCFTIHNCYLTCVGYKLPYICYLTNIYVSNGITYACNHSDTTQHMALHQTTQCATYVNAIQRALTSICCCGWLYNSWHMSTHTLHQLQHLATHKLHQLQHLSMHSLHQRQHLAIHIKHQRQHLAIHIKHQL